MKRKKRRRRRKRKRRRRRRSRRGRREERKRRRWRKFSFVEERRSGPMAALNRSQLRGVAPLLSPPVLLFLSREDSPEVGRSRNNLLTAS